MKTFKFFLIFICLLTGGSIYSQAPAKQWDARFGGTEYDYLSSVQQTREGGYILGGTSTSGIGGDKTQAMLGGNDYWVVKTDASGAKKWDARFGGNGADQFSCLQQTTDGGYILGGSLAILLPDVDGGTSETFDYWVVKIDANGQKQWDARFGSNTGSDDRLSSVCQTADGGYLLGGSTASGIGGDKTQSSRGGTDYWVVKISGSGQKQWDARFGGSLDDILSSVKQTSDTGYILGGFTYSTIGGDISQSGRGITDYWVVKISRSGAKQWDARFGGSERDELSSVEQTTEGGYILGGFSESGISGDKTQASRGVSDYWVVKIANSGVKQWDARFGGSSYETCTSLKQTIDGGYILGGNSMSAIGGDKTQGSQGIQDYWILKITSNGSKLWDARFGGTAGDYFGSLQQTNDGGFILGGSTYSAMGGDKSQPSRGSEDYWIVKVAPECTPTTLKPATPGVISGAIFACPATIYSYNIADVSRAATYTWTLPANCTISSGQGTNSIKVLFSSSFTQGNISVKASNCNGTSNASSITVKKTTSTPSTPVITPVVAPICPGNHTYSVAQIANATVYNWIAPPATSIISGQGTNTITLNVTSNFTGGNLRVTASNCIGTSGSATVALTKSNNCGGILFGKTDEVSEEPSVNTEALGAELNIKIYPNPFAREFHVNLENFNEEAYEIRIFDIMGQLVQEQREATNNAEITLGNNLTKGTYLIEVKQGNNRKVMRLSKSE